MDILVTGGCGYTGSILVRKLLSHGHKVRVIDTQWFGNYLKKHKNLKIIKKDIRDIDSDIFKGMHAIVHLANIANDPSVELNQNLSWEVNVLSIKKIVEHSIKHKLKKFIFASSGSVYGIKKEKKVTEKLDLVPISIYNKTKMIAEKVLDSYSKLIDIYHIRPATVCGYSPRMRLDISVNMFVYQALKYKKIKIFGGSQIRPNIHINDLVGVYEHVLFNKIKPGVYNAGFENLKIIDIAKLVKKHIPCQIKVIKNTNDPRTYRQNSDKLLTSGFKPHYNVEKAILEIKERYAQGKLKDDDICYTVKWMKKLKIK